MSPGLGSAPGVAYSNPPISPGLDNSFLRADRIRVLNLFLSDILIYQPKDRTKSFSSRQDWYPNKYFSDPDGERASREKW